MRSSLTCPLIVEGRVVGFMFRSSRQPGAYTQHHVELQMALTERLSQAVEKAWRIEQLTAANRNYLEMLGFVSHELKNPVASMVTDARLLADGYLGPLDDQQKAKLERLITKGEYLLDLVREYLDLARVEGGELQVSLQCGVPFVDEGRRARARAGPAADRGGRHGLDDRAARRTPRAHGRLRPRRCSPSCWSTCWATPCATAGPGGGLRLTVRPTPRRLRVAVWNEGPGFSRAERARLFRKFSRLHTPTDRPTAGHRPGPVQFLAHRPAPPRPHPGRRPAG